MSSITRNNFSIHSNSKGNLLKTEYQKDGICILLNRDVYRFVIFLKSGELSLLLRCYVMK